MGIAGRLQPSKNLANAGLGDTETTGKLSLILDLAAVEKCLVAAGEGEWVAFGLRRGWRGRDGVNGHPGVELDGLGSAT